MSGTGFLRIKKLNGGGIIKVAARHNKRAIQAEIGTSGSIDPTRSHLNESVVGPSTAEEVAQLAKDLMKAADVTKPRKDAVMGIEIVFSLPPEHRIDDKAYFSDCTAWAGAYFGGVQNILSADIHRDEAAPHCHVLLLPLIDGRLNGSGLVGNRQKLMAMQTQFHQDVAARYGLRKAPARLNSPAKLAASTAVLKRMRQTDDKALQSAAWPSIRAGIENDPRPFLLTMGIEVATPKKKLKSMAEIFTGKGKGAQLETKRIGFAAPANDRTLCSVGFTSEKLTAAARADLRPALPAANNAGLEQADIAPLPPIETETTHIRDIDLDPARYDENGDYCPMPHALVRH